MNFKIILQIKSRVLNRTSDYLSLTQPEFQCVYTKYKNKNTMKPKLNNNLSLPWTLQGEKASENHQIL